MRFTDELPDKSHNETRVIRKIFFITFFGYEVETIRCKCQMIQVANKTKKHKIAGKSNNNITQTLENTGFRGRQKLFKKSVNYVLTFGLGGDIMLFADAPKGNNKER